MYLITIISLRDYKILCPCLLWKILGFPIVIIPPSTFAFSFKLHIKLCFIYINMQVQNFYKIKNLINFFNIIQDFKLLKVSRIYV